MEFLPLTEPSSPPPNSTIRTPVASPQRAACSSLLRTQRPLLLNGTVLVTHSIVGYDRFGEVFVRHAELYERSTGSFTATGEMTDFHNNPTATLLRNGDVLIAGGDVGDGDGPSAAAERYDPESRAFSASGGLTARQGGPHGHSSLGGLGSLHGWARFGAAVGGGEVRQSRQRRTL